MTVVLITGANKGIGYETARQLREAGHTVYIGARDPERGRAAADRLGAHFLPLDVTRDESVAAAFEELGRKHDALDVLINNAGVYRTGVGTAELAGADVLHEFDTNVVGVVRVTQAALPLLRHSSNPVVVNLGSGQGSFWAVTNSRRSESDVPLVSYGASKAAVAMLTVQYANAEPSVKFNCAAPGFTATDFTADFGGGQPVEAAAAIVVQLASIGPDGPTGTLQEIDGVLPW